MEFALKALQKDLAISYLSATQRQGLNFKHFEAEEGELQELFVATQNFVLIYVWARQGSRPTESHSRLKMAYFLTYE